MIKYAILCEYPSGRVCMATLGLYDEPPAAEFVEGFGLCYPGNIYTVVKMDITNAQQLPVQQAVHAGILECPVG